MMGPYDPAAVPGTLYALQAAARHDSHERMVLADWYEEVGRPELAEATRELHGLYRPDVGAMSKIMVSRPEVARLWRDELPERTHRTRKRVDKMTADEVGRMPEWAAKWTKIGLSTERADRPMFEAAVAACYRYSGLPNPKAVIWAPCPIVVAYAGSIVTAVLQRIGQSGDSVYASVTDSVARSVRASVEDSVARSVGASVSRSVGDSVRDSVARSVYASVDRSVEDSVAGSVGASVYASVGDSVSRSVAGSVGARVGASVQDSVNASAGVHAVAHAAGHAAVHACAIAVGDSVRSSVGDSVYASVYASVDRSVEDSVAVSVQDSINDSVRRSVRASAEAGAQDNTDLSQWHLYNGGQFWVGGWYWWGPSSVSFAIDVLRLNIGREQELTARAYAAALSSACWWWPHQNFVIVSERPSLIDRHPNGKLREARWEWVDDDNKRCEWSVKT